MGGNHYALADRARRLLRAHGGRVSETDLLAGLFGRSTDTHRWGELLTRLLEPCSDLRRDASGGWELLGPPERQPGDGSQLKFVALSTTATSADPWRARLVALAAVRVQDGRLGARYEAVLNPRARVPRFVLETTALSQADIEEAPAFADLVDELVVFFGDAPIVGLEIKQQLDLLSHELARLDRPGLRNPVLDLGQLAERAGLTVKPNLVTLAAALGEMHPRPHYPPADARVVASLASRLLPRLGAADHSVEGLAAEPGQAASALLRPDPPRAPTGPGVYLLRDSQGQVLYVGKARQLRRRLGEYHRRQLGLLRRLEGLAAAVAEVETISTISELEALVLEARLVRRYRPPYNTQRRARFPALFLRADLDPLRATLTTCREPAADGARYVGPFRSARSAGQALGLLRALFPVLRRRARAGAAERWPALLQALEFLDGGRDAVLDRLQDEQRRLAAGGDRAALDASQALLRRTLDFELDVSTTALSGWDSRLLVLSPGDPVQREGVVAHLIVAGRLRAAFEAASAGDARRKAQETGDRCEQPGGESDPAETADESAVVYRWLSGLGRDGRVELLPAAVPGSDRLPQPGR